MAAGGPSAWEHWGGDQGGTRFSRPAQITPANVGLGGPVQHHERACSGGCRRYKKVSGSLLSLDLRSVRTALGLFDVQRLNA